MRTDEDVSLREKVGPGKRVWLLAYLGFVGVYTLAFAVVMTRGVSPFVTGDWLINYSGGFVRRGLVGALVLVLHRAAGLAAAWIVFGIEAAAFLGFLGCVYRLSEGVRWSYWMAAVVLSPATLAFTVMDSYAGLRKETLLFAALGMTLCVVRFGRVRDWVLVVMLSVFAVGLTLSHEGLAVCAPYFFAAIAARRGVSRAVKICLLPALLGVGALVAVALHPGDVGIAAVICGSIGGVFGSPEPNICSGSIAWLQFGSTQVHGMVVEAVRHYHRVRLYSLLAVPTFAPLIGQMLLVWRSGRRRELVVVLWCAVVSMVETGFLFYFAMDWGRWMHMQAVCLMLMVLMVERTDDHQATMGARVGVTTAWMRFASIVAVGIYATTWTLPPTGRGDGQRGYVDVARTLRAMYRGG